MPVATLLHSKSNTRYVARGMRGVAPIAPYAALLVTALAFFLRVRALTLFQFHIDEFFTLTAANFIAKSGRPLYPTGLFYDPGLPYSYLTGGTFWLLGFSEALGRWPAVLFGTLSVATVYWLGARVLRSPAVGLLAALWLALSLESIEWGGRARMITLAQWLALVSVALLWLGLTQNSTRKRLLFALSYGLTLLTHFSTIVLMPAWFVAAGVLWRVKAIRFQKTLLRDAFFLLLAFALAVSSGIIFQPPPTIEFQTGSGDLGTKTGILTNKFLQIPSDTGHAWQNYSPYFLNSPHGLVLAFGLAGLAISLIYLVTSRRSSPQSSEKVQRTIGALVLGSIFLTVMLTLMWVIAPHWQRARYLLMQVQGLFLLLGAHGIREVVLAMPWPGRKTALWQSGAAIVAAVIVSAPFLGPLMPLVDAGSTGWNRYDLAFGHVRDNLSEGDTVMTMHPPASLLYLEQSDYYLRQTSPKLIMRPDGALGDRYSGAIWLQSVAEFNGLLRESNRVWLVTQEFWLFNSYTGYLQQQILWQMDKLWGEGGVWALLSRAGSWPLAKNAANLLNADFEGGTRLLGYTANPPAPVPGGVMQLTLFWQGAIPHQAKVFVQLRDETNGTVAQADHFIYDGKVPTSRWPELLENDTAIRDGATLALPPDLAPGRYRLVVGFYHPETFERLGVINDNSGENAVILNEWRVN